MRRRSPLLLCAALVLAATTLLPTTTSAQLTLTSGVQKYAALTGTTANLGGKCELWVTNASAPLSGCTINLNSIDAWLFLPGIKPSAAASTYLAQVRISGAAAVADSNCRVVQYGMGAVVIPQASTLQPLTVYTGPHFTGASASLNQYVYYNSAAALGAFNANISSFKLKRGYAVTLAQNASGSAYSRNYVAADGDLEVSVLPPTLDNNVRFAYVTPWRWTSKKGIAGNPGNSLLNLQWWYNWNLDQNSSRDLEYVAIRQQRWWPSLSQNWKTRGINTLLGYNEPDHTDQANIAVGDAIWSWPDLLATGLRVGSPAPSDGGYSSWLYPFMDQADAASLRVDFVAVHYYRCYNPADPAGAANQMYNALKGIYDRTKRPLWVTEWNNGANWTSCADPTYAQQQACIAAMINMLDTTPFVERYALYNWVEDVRAVVTNGVLTGAGVVYRDQASPLGYVQALQDNGTRSLTQLRFETNTLDSSGYGNNGITAGSPAYAPGHSGQALVFDGANTVVTLPPNVATNNAFTFAAWVKWNGGANWQRIFDFGNSTTDYLFLTPSASGGYLRFAIKNGGAEQTVQTAALPSGSWQHVAVTLSGSTASLYVNGALAARNTALSLSPASFAPRLNRLGQSQFRADPLFSGLMDEVLITDYALSATQIARLLTNTPPQFTSSVLARPGATEALSYSGTLAGAATDPDPGDTLTYSKTAGPAWLTVAPNGTLGGTPSSGDGGTNVFTVRVTDAAGQSGFAILNIPVTITTASGTWTADASANWSDPTRWSGNVVASGVNQAADFSTIDITADRTVTLDSSRTLGSLKFGDSSGAQNWTLAAGNGCSLRLDTGSAAAPLITVVNTATISAPLAGTNGFAKTGAGTLVLSGDNALTGMVNIDSGSTTANDGITRLVGPGALGNAGLINIRNSNGGSSTLQLDGSAGSITVDADVVAACRNNGVVTIDNLAGTNIFNGNIFLQAGGGAHTVQAAANSLVVFTGPNQYVGSLAGARTYYFTGAGDHLLLGPVLNSTNGSPIALSKSGTGTLTLEAENTYGAGTTLAGGTLLVNGTLPPGPLIINPGATLGGHGLIYPAVNLPSGATLAPGNRDVGTLTVEGDVILQPGSITCLELNQAAGRNDQLRVAGTLNYGGTLLVTNLRGTFWAGDAFKLFEAGSYTGSFAATNLPPLTGGLVWQFDPATGLLRVAEPGVPGTPPAAPTALTAVGANGAVKLTWVQSATAEVTTNCIYRSSNGLGGPFSLLAAVPANIAFEDATVLNDVGYYYAVTALSSNGESAWSGIAAATPAALRPYAPDPNTLHLWHFDSPTLATPDQVATGGLTLTNYAQSPTPSTTLSYMTNGAPAVTAPFGTCLHIVATNANAGNCYAVATTNSGASLTPAAFSDLVSGAFTFEALVNLDGSPTNGNGNWQIISGDSGNASRSWQFRLNSGAAGTNAARLEFNSITAANGVMGDFFAFLPTTGSDAWTTGKWFHVALTYTGNAPANGDTPGVLTFYWTAFNATNTQATLLTNVTIASPGTLGGNPVLGIGGSARANNGIGNNEGFRGYLDEVRISNVARAATDFFWHPPSTLTAPLNLKATADYGRVELGWSLVSGAASYNLKRVAASGASFSIITNVAATSFTDTGLVGGTTYYYVVSAVNSAGESVNSLPVSATIPVMTPPGITSATVSGTDFVIAGAGGVPGFGYQLYSTTNPALPLSQWTLAQTNLAFDPGGNFALTNPIASGEPARFFRIAVPGAQP